MYSDETIAKADAEIHRLSDWERKHRRPPGLFFLRSKGFDVHDVWEGITSEVYSYLQTKDRAAYARHGQFTLIGHRVWIAMCVATNHHGYMRLYLRQIAAMGATLSRVLEMRHRNAVWHEQAKAKIREDAERLERQRTPSPWGNAVCDGCGGKKRVWADDANGVRARCQTPLQS